MYKNTHVHSRGGAYRYRQAHRNRRIQTSQAHTRKHTDTCTYRRPKNHTSACTRWHTPSVWQYFVCISVIMFHWFCFVYFSFSRHTSFLFLSISLFPVLSEFFVRLSSSLMHASARTLSCFPWDDRKLLFGIPEEKRLYINMQLRPGPRVDRYK